MPPTKYKIWQWGGPVGEGATQSEYVGLAGVAKGNSAGMPLIVANEYICGTVGRCACLPIPPAAIVEKNGDPYHVSLDFSLAGQKPPPADAAATTVANPELACGIVLFDVWFINVDRHNKNLSFDPATGLVQLFDHSHAFLQEADPAAYLQRHQNSLGIGAHCLAPHLTSLAGMRLWFDRFNAIPEFFVKETIETATGLGLPGPLAQPAIDFLLERRGRLLELVNASRATFPRVAVDLWDQLVPGGNP